jgi:hypothetical protein
MKPPILKQYQGLEMSLSIASRIFTTLIQNRKTTGIREEGIIEFFDLQVRIYIQGQERGYWE